MIKKRVSWQTLAIIILGSLLLITIAFGGVFAFYSARTNQVSGQIMMANLSISLEGNTDQSAASNITIGNAKFVVPGQVLDNTPLVVRNLSTVEIYLVVAYEIKAERVIVDDFGNKLETTEIEDEYLNPVFGLGCEYLNIKDPTKNITTGKDVYNEDWFDFVFWGEKEERYYRCMVSKKSIPKKDSKNNAVVVIHENTLTLHRFMGPEYVDTTISFWFQAYAVGAATNFDIKEGDSNLEKCNKIVNFVYESQGYEFFKHKK